MNGSRGAITVKPSRENGSTLRVAYLFSGISRKSSIASELKKLCEQSGLGLIVDEIDIYNGGSSHDLLDPEVQANLEKKISQGGYDVVVISPPCATWSRANYNPPPGGRPDPRYPDPCRSKQHPWGFPDSKPATRRRADLGNAFIHFALRAVAASAKVWREEGKVVRVLL